MITPNRPGIPGVGPAELEVFPMGEAEILVKSLGRGGFLAGSSPECVHVVLFSGPLSLLLSRYFLLYFCPIYEKRDIEIHVLCVVHNPSTTSQWALPVRFDQDVFLLSRSLKPLMSKKHSSYHMNEMLGTTRFSKKTRSVLLRLCSRTRSSSCVPCTEM